MITAWRIVKRKHARTAFTGEGARIYGGRWDSPGVAIVYTAESQSLAALEMVVHLDSSALLLSYVVFEVGIDESLVSQVGLSKLPRNWRDDPPPVKAREVGDAWAMSGKSAVLQVPSATLPAEYNFLLNPHHPDFSKLAIGNPSSSQYDARLARRSPAV
jgi:RES domain-containing protein